MTDKTETVRTSRSAASQATLWALVLSSMISTPVWSAQTDISSAPITSTNAAQVKPNIMLLMDTSGSMGWGHMPDEIETQVGIGSIGYKAAQCNVLYYNRAQTYSIPKLADGSLFPVPSFNGARYDAFDTTNLTTVDLAANFKAYDDKTLRTSGYNDHYPSSPNGIPAYYYYKTGGSVTIAAYSDAPCLDSDVDVTTPSSDGGTWNRVVVGSSSGVAGADERTNFAVWYAYYRTRILLIKSAASLAFTPLTDSFRVGFITVKPKDNKTDAAINPAKYLAIDDFNAVQRGLWFTKLFSQKPGGSSPTREGLARVGRHYAGKQDGINTGMTGDPVQYSCQQNFTIMTTDGYWNAQDESTSSGLYLGGPVDISGQALVGQRDGNLDSFSTNSPSPSPAADVNVTPRPIWDGQFDGTRTITTKRNAYAYQGCGTYFNKTTSQYVVSTSQLIAQTTQTQQSTVQNLQSTTQALQTTAQTLRSTSQTAQSTVQNLASTNTNLRSSTQRLQSTTQTTQSTLQNRQSTNQNRQSTVQNLQNSSQGVEVKTRRERRIWTPRQSTVQNLQSTTQTRQSTSQQNQQTQQRLQSTVQNLASTTQTNRSTVQTTQSTVQNLKSTVQNLQSTAQATRSTTQTTQTTTQVTGTSSQILASTQQQQISTSQIRRSTSQLRSCDASTELCTPGPVASCTPGGNITCETVTTGPTLVASCTNDPAAAGNNYTATTCATTGTGPTATGSCSPSSASSSNSYTTTVCSFATTGPSPVGSCSPAAAAAGNSWVQTTCSATSTGAVPAASCTPTSATAGNSWTTTTCATNTTGPIGVASCTPQGATSANAWTAVGCSSASTTNVPVASCTPASAASGNNWTTTTCGTNNTANAPVASCSSGAPTSGNNWTTTTCSTNNSSGVAVASCSPSAATSANSWTTTTCGTNNTTNTPSGSCVASGATAGNSWTTTTCPNVTTGPTPSAVASCTAATGNAGNSWTTTTCPVTSTGPTPVASCTTTAAASGNAWTATTCSTNNSSNTPVASCTAAAATSANAWTTTSCANNNSALTPVSSCSVVAANSGNSYTATACPVVTTGPTGVSSCTGSAASSGNAWTTTTCAANNTSNVAVSSCTASGPGGGNGYTTTTCSNNNTTNVAVASCTPITATAANSWTTTTCPPETLVSDWTPVSSCTVTAASAGNGFQRTECQNVVTNTPVQAGTCVVDPATAANNWTATTCTNNNTANVPVASCTPQTAAAGNSWVTITCGSNNTTNVAVVTCTASSATAANFWTTTTCPAPITTGPTPVASCTAAPANSGNGYVSTSCPAPITTGPTGVSSCTAVAAASGNAWTATTCGSNNSTNVPVASCAPITAASGNGWTTTTCSDNNTANVAVATCAPQTAASGNSWITVTCPPPTVTTNVPVSSCTPDSVATAGNGYTTRTCSTNNTTNVASGTCVASSATSGNAWTTTTCPVVTTGPTAVASCTAATGNSGNAWTTTTCAPNNSSNVAVSSCTPAAPVSGNGYTTVTCTNNNTSNVAVASCSAGSPTSGNGYTTTSCSTNNTTAVPVSSCTASSATAANNWTTTTCPVNSSGPVGASSCTPTAPSAANNWTTTTCPGTLTTGPTPALTCTTAAAAAGNSWTATTCGLVATGPTVVATCTTAAAIAGNSYTATTCTPVSGSQLTTTNSTRVQQYNVSGGVQSSTGSDTTTSVGPTASGACYAPGTAPALPADGVATWTTADATSNPSCSGWPCTVDSNTNDPRSVNSLADVAQYYYVTDLRTAANEPRGAAYYRDDVPAVGSGAEDDRVRWQHMTTFSIALGVSGSLAYKPDYKTATTGDFASIRLGTKNWPLWPDPTAGYYNDANNYNDPRSIDDFWHAAVNGRGTYFSASNPTSVIAGLSNALAGVTARVASSSGAAVSNLEPVSGDNFVYMASYTTQQWSGDVQAHEIAPATGLVQSPILWSAQAKLDAITGNACDNRKVYLMRQGATNNLVNFSWNSRACDTSGSPTGTADTGLNSSEQGNFAALNVSLLSQYPSMGDGTGGTVDQRTPAAGANLVNFLRGQRGFEDFTANDVAKLYRKRDHVLGDTVNGQPVYVRSPFADYSDTGYAAFKAAQSGRTPMLYVPANDGMLHAFYAGTSGTDVQGGKEAWAVIPSTVLPNLYKLAHQNYKNLHQYSVDGTPTVSDFYTGSAWKTLLVGGLNAGGRGFYALDVTDPVAPKGMWEFKWSDTCYDANVPATAYADCHIGLSFGKPLITKLADGRWVVLVTSGYNNVNATPKTGDGLGYLYVLDAVTGKILYKISTGAGSSGTPSGLAQINNFVDKAEIDNVSVRVYGTDLLGNVWRFDINDTSAPSGREAVLVGTAKDSGGNPQPITTRAELTQIGGKPMLFVATGRLLGATDVSDLQVQSVYGIVDPLTATTAFADLRGAMVPLQMTQVGSGTGATRTIACSGSTTQCASTDGWRIDLPDSGERVNVEMKLRSQTLVIGSNVPQISACSAGGYSWLNYLNFKSGLAVTGSAGLSVSEQVSNSLIVGLTVVKLAGGTIKAIVTSSDGGVLARTVPTYTEPTGFKRISWREVATQ